MGRLITEIGDLWGPCNGVWRSVAQLRIDCWHRADGTGQIYLSISVSDGTSVEPSTEGDGLAQYALKFYTLLLYFLVNMHFKMGYQKYLYYIILIDDRSV